MSASWQQVRVRWGHVIDLDSGVGSRAGASSVKEWNAGGVAGRLTDGKPDGKDPSGVWCNRVHSYELAETAPGADAPDPALTLPFPPPCRPCETPACVTVCPAGASYKPAEDGIVLVNGAKCIGCKLSPWPCPYGARESSPDRKSPRLNSSHSFASPIPSSA